MRVSQLNSKKWSCQCMKDFSFKQEVKKTFWSDEGGGLRTPWNLPLDPPLLRTTSIKDEGCKSLNCCLRRIGISLLLVTWRCFPVIPFGEKSSSTVEVSFFLLALAKVTFIKEQENMTESNFRGRVSLVELWLLGNLELVCRFSSFKLCSPF